MPIGFMKHVEKALPNARHVELECGHVPQVERPRETHAAIAQVPGRVIGVRAAPRAPAAEPRPGRVRDRVAVRLDGPALAPLRRRLLLALPDLRPRGLRGRPSRGQARLHGRPDHLPRRRGQHARPRRRARRALAAHARRGAPHEPAQAAAAAVPRRERAPLRRGDGRGHRARGGELAARQGDPAAPAHAGDHARGDPARGLRRARRRAHGPVPRAHPAARRADERPELDAVLRARPRRAHAARRASGERSPRWTS